jgi:zinc transport system ATP-binding protein
MAEKTVNPEPSLELLHREKPIFQSFGHWLHPLFELEDFLAAHSYPLNEMVLRDKIIGKAAALLIVRLGIRQVEAGLLSRLGESTLETHGVRYSCSKCVDRIACQTEELLRAIDDADEAYSILAKRAGREDKKRYSA